MKAGRELPQIYQQRHIAWSLTLIGGFIDAYTFLQYGGVLAAGQTGNLVFLAGDIARGDATAILLKAATILSFSLGVLVATAYKQYHRTHYWRILVLMLIAMLGVILGFLPSDVPNLVVMPSLAFAMAMQTTVFSEIAGRGYANVFSTGNLKKAMIALMNYRLKQADQDKQSAQVFGGLVLSFLGGAILSALLQRWLGPKAIWIMTVLMLAVMLDYAYLLYRRDSDNA